MHEMFKSLRWIPYRFGYSAGPPKCTKLIRLFLKTACSSGQARYFHPSLTRLAKRMIEVEKKFTVNDAVLENLKLLGARLEKESTFTDVYYDNKKYMLTLNNFWLRQRDGLWQLKSPIGSRSADDSLTNSSYKESESELEILNLLMPILCEKDEDKNYILKHLDSVDGECKQFSILVKVLGHMNCKSFCKISTTRQSYTLNEFNIDLDVTDSGYRVGEIELLADEEDDILLMTQKIDGLSEQLGVPTHAQVSGKLGHYLMKHSPNHYCLLFKRKVLV